MQKIDLPIEKEETDEVSPLKPDLKWWWKMLIFWIVSFWIIYLCFFLFAKIIIWNISIENEKKYFSKIFLDENVEVFNKEKLVNNNIPDIEKYNLYITESEEINAYATLWWNILITRWLIENLTYEEELIFIIWHEIQHIKNRDVLNALLTDIPVKLSLYFLWFEWLIWFNLSDYALNYKSRTTEEKADIWWINLINSMWLNLECSSNFFEEENSIFEKYLEINSTHPSSLKRKENLIKNSTHILKECTILNYN